MVNCGGITHHRNLTGVPSVDKVEHGVAKEWAREPAQGAKAGRGQAEHHDRVQAKHLAANGVNLLLRQDGDARHGRGRRSPY